MEPPKPKTIISYVEPLSVAPGQRLDVMVSCEAGDAFRADLVRLICGDPRQRGAGYQEHVVESSLSGHAYPARFQALKPGSYATLEGLPAFSALSWHADVMPTTPHRPRQTIVAGPGDVALSIAGGRLTLHAGKHQLQIDAPMTAARWHHVAIECDGATTTLRCETRGLTVAEPAALARSATGQFRIACPAGDWQLAARAGVPGFNGRIEAPRFEDGGELIAAWDFSRDMASAELVETVRGYRGIAHQHPARAVTGAAWDGSTQRWRDDPSQYAAIHFHEDDLTDAGWAPDITWQVPKDLPSGVYAVRLTTATSEDHAVFFVRPGARARPAPVLYLAATATYTAYANQTASLSRNRNPSDAYFLSHPEVGKSLYESHVDGSGVMYSSRKRPVLNLKPRTVTWSFNADTSVTAWLTHIGAHHDVATDEDLHHEGADLLRRYRAVITGTHPEYYSTAMLDGVQDYLAGGGRLMYLGGNGFYWRIAFDPADPAVIEVRRAEDGTRTWIAEPGEYYHSFTGEYGGLWRRMGRPPNHLVGIGFAAQGFDGGTYYRLRPGASSERAGFIMEGVVAQDIIGNHGSQGGGAAGEEIDRWDPSLGSPAHALILASSERHGPNMLRVKEEFQATEHPDPKDPNVRADMVFFETPAGGAVFSTGSISFAGALATDDYDNDIARITGNVLARFSDPKPFAYPEGDAD